jgi:hypothetical protein
LAWISGGKDEIGGFLSKNRNRSDIDDVKKHFNRVIDWVSSVFVDIENEMRHIDWGRLFDLYAKKKYDPKKMAEGVRRLYGDPYVKNRRNIFEYLLSGETDSSLLDIRIFDEATKRVTYEKQVVDSNRTGLSNCPLCAVGN